MTDETKQPEDKAPAPESFPPELLAQPVGARLEYFEQRCLISHSRLQEALDAIIQAICPPGEGAETRRPGTMVLVIGPSRVGKSTLIRMLEEQLLTKSKALMVSDSSFIPFASITASGAGTNRFEWAEYYRAVLRALQDPFVDGKIARIRTRELREAMETALLERKPLAILVDEAHHLAEAARGSRLQSQLNHLKHFENATGVSHIMYHQKPLSLTIHWNPAQVDLNLSSNAVFSPSSPTPTTQNQPHRLEGERPRSPRLCLDCPLHAYPPPQSIKAWRLVKSRGFREYWDGASRTGNKIPDARFPTQALCNEPSCVQQA